MSVKTATDGANISSNNGKPCETIAQALQTLANTTTSTASNTLSVPNRIELGAEKMPTAVSVNGNQTACETTTTRVAKTAPEFSRQKTDRAKEFFTQAAVEASKPKTSSQSVLVHRFETPTKAGPNEKHVDTPRPNEPVQPGLVATKFVPHKQGQTQAQPESGNNPVIQKISPVIASAKTHFEALMPKMNAPNVSKDDRVRHLLEMLEKFDKLVNSSNPDERQPAITYLRQILPDIRSQCDEILNPMIGDKPNLKNTNPISKYNQLAKQCNVPEIDNPVKLLGKVLIVGKSNDDLRAQIAEIRGLKSNPTAPVSDEDSDEEIDSPDESEEAVVFHEDPPANGPASKSGWAWGHLKSVGGAVWGAAAKVTKAVVDYGKSWLTTATPDEIEAVADELQAELDRREEKSSEGKEGKDELPSLEDVENKNPLTATGNLNLHGITAQTKVSF